MNLLKDLLLNEENNKGEVSNKLTDYQIDVIKKNIRTGAKPDKESGEFQPWANALQLVHKAYEVANIQRPTPGMKDLWDQYVEIIKFAVKELAKTRGIDGDWRMTAHELQDKG